MIRHLYVLEMDDPDPLSIVLLVRTDDAGLTAGELRLPDWQEIRAGFDGPHSIESAVSLADSYAGYHAIAIEIESSQMLQAEWGTLDTARDQL